MPAATDIEMRDRALIAFGLLTGTSDGARASLKLKHVDLAQSRLDQDAREVKTKFSKTFSTWFFPVVGDALPIFSAWVQHLRHDLFWSDSDPLFPATRLGIGPDGGLVAVGLKREHRSTAEPIRRIFREGFGRAGLPYFKPHSIRDTLVQFGEQVCKTPEQFKAWSQNLGHEKVLTTFTSYGAVASHRQAALIRELGEKTTTDEPAGSVVARLARIEALMSPRAVGAAR